MKRILYFGAAALGFLFTACQSDELTPENGQSDKDGDKTFYVNMRISGDPSSMSRAADENGSPAAGVDFVDGTENFINNAFFVFYDTDGNVVGDLVQVELDDKKLVANPTPDGTVEKSYKSTVAVTVRKGAQKPAQVICYINPIDPSNLLARLNVIQTVARDEIYKLGANGVDKYFAMSNSVYYTDETDPNCEPQVAVPIPDGALYETEEGALEALDKKNTDGTDDPTVINIYVERYATKLSFSVVKEPDVYKSASRVYRPNSLENDIVSVDLTFEPQYWALNAEAKQSYVTKSFREESSLGDILINNYSLSKLNSRINPKNIPADAKGYDVDNLEVLDINDQWDWNNPLFHRSYWAMSPAYFQDEYPEVRSDLDYIKDENGVSNIKQTYIPYIWLSNGSKGYAVNDATSNDPHYFKETTVGSMGITSSNPAAAVASVIYVGQYRLKVAGVDVNNPTFYSYLRGAVEIEGKTVDRPYIYFDGKEDNPTESAVAGGESLLKRMFAQSTILYKRRAGHTGTSSDDFEKLVISDQDHLALLTSALQVDTLSDKVKRAADGNEGTMLKVRNNARALQFKKGYSTGENGVYIVTQNGYKKVVPDKDENLENDEIGITTANLALMRQVGMAYKYVTGLAYFSIPVKHLGWYRKGNTQRGADKIDWSKVRVGDFGMVRNHSYSIEVQSITGLADGIGDPYAPIVPPSTSQDYFMAYAVRILKWAVVPTQKVTL